MNDRSHAAREGDLTHGFLDREALRLDFALRALDATQTNDFYEIVVERHRRNPTIWVSNREPAEWLGLTTDALLAQSAIDRLTSGAHTLVVEGPSYRQRGRVTVDPRHEVRHAR